MWIHVTGKGGDRKIEVAAAPFCGSEPAREEAGTFTVFID
ncbi:hypothetical protein AB7M32_003388 [Pseudomonas sp. R151218B TE3479]